MHKLFTLLLLGFLPFVGGALSAQAVESFDYTVGEGLDGKSGGTEWSSPWIFRKGANQVTIGAGGISVPALGLASHSNHAFTTHPGSGGTRQFRSLTNPVTDDGGTYYLSWFMDNDYDNPPANGSVHQVMLVDSASFGASGPGGQILRMGKIFGTERFGIDGGASGGAKFINGTDTRDAMWVVVKLEMSGNDDPETLSFYVNPALDTDFATAAADFSFTPTLNNGFNSIGVKLEGGAPVDGFLDELRFGTSPADVISPNIVFAPGRNIDQFNEYAAGTDSLDGQSGGLGWGGPWNVVSGNNPSVEEGGIQNFTILRETSGNRISMPFLGDGNGNSRLERPLNTTFQDDGSTYYFSYSTVSTFTNRGGQVNYFMLVDTTAYAPTGPGGQLVQIGKPLNTPFIGAGLGGTNNFSLTDAMAEDPHLVVVKVSTSGNADPDTVRLYIDPSLDMEPADADATKLIGTNLNNGFNAVGFKVEGLSPGNVMEFDDVMVGVNYADVIPPDLGILQPLTNAFASENFNTYGVGDSLPGLDGGNGWAGAWYPFRSDVDSSAMQAGGLINESLLIRTSGPSLRMSSAGGNQRILRNFENGIDTTENADFWFSVQLGVESTANNFVGNVILADTSIAGGGFQQVILGKPFGNSNLFAGGFGQVTGNEPIVPGAFAGNATHWVVGHMTRDSGLWALDVFVNPDFTGSEPDESSAALINKLYRSGNFNAFGIKAEANRGIDWLVDDVYFGDDFGDVIPPDLEAIPARPDGAAEPFDYAAGNDFIDQNGGSGWAGPWELLTDAGNGVIVEDGIESIPLLKSTSGPSNQIPTLIRAVRPLDGAYGDFGRDFWIGWWAQTQNPGGNVSHLVLADTATYGATGPGGQLVQIGKIFGGAQIGVVAAQGGNASADISAADGHFFVAKISTNGNAANDRITLWIDPALDTPPSEEDAAVSAAADLTNWNGIGFKFEGGLGESVAFFDDILVAGTFAEVIPNDLLDIEPPALPQVGVDLFEYEAGSDLNGLDGGEGWAGAWTVTSGAATIAAGSIDSDRTCGEGNQASIDQMGGDNPVSANRAFFNPFGVIEESTNEVYVSFTLNIDDKGIGNSGLVSLRDTEGNNIISVGGVPGVSDLGIIVADGNPQTSSAQPVTGSKWVVMRFDLSGDEALDGIKVWIDPAADAIPVDASALFDVSDVAINDGIASLQLDASGVQALSMLFDDFRIGFSYRDISCKFGSDDPNLLAYEPFNYDAGQSLIGLGGVNAFWDGVWEDLAGIGDDNVAEIESGSLEYPNTSTIGNKAELNFIAVGNQIRINRKLAFPLESDGSTYWLTFFMNTTDGAADDNVGNIMLRNSEIADKAGQRLAFGRMFDSGKLGFITPPNNQARTSDFEDAGLNWIVAKIVTTGSESPVDTVYMWVNPPAAGVEPDTSEASFFQVSTTPHLKAGIDYLMLKAEGAGADQVPYVTEFDEIRLATAWPSAVATGTIQPIPGDVYAFRAYPNPFRDRITFEYELPNSGRVDVAMYDFNGRLVRTLYAGEQAAGAQQLVFDDTSSGGQLANGFYFVRLVHNGKSITRKLILYR